MASAINEPTRDVMQLEMDPSEVRHWQDTRFQRRQRRALRKYTDENGRVRPDSWRRGNISGKPVPRSPSSPADQFTYNAAGPAVSSIAPTSGTAAGGDSVTSTGSGFTGATTVNFGPNAATNLNVGSDTQITCTSPAGTGTVDVSVVGPGGTSATSAADQFTYS